MGNRISSCLAALLAAAVCAAGAPSGAQAQAEVVAPPRFEIIRFEVLGNVLLPASELERVFEPYTGRNKDFGDIQRALESLEAAYRDRGYGTVQVLLAEQDITRGVVQFRVLQPRVGKVLIEGNAHFDDENIRRSLPTVKEGEVPNSKDIARNLQLLGEHPVKQTNVLLRSGAAEDQVDVNVKVTDDRPWRGFITLDNTGTGDTGYYRMGVGFQHSNLFNRDHSLTAQYVTSPTDPEQVKIYGAGYRLPFYEWNSSLDLIVGYSDVDSGTVQGLFNVSGQGTIGIVRWNIILPKQPVYEHKLALGLDYRAYTNQVLVPGDPTSLVPDVTVRPASLSYSGLWRAAAAELSFYGSAFANIPGGKNAEDAAFEASRTGAIADYALLRAGFNYLRQFRSDWQARLGFNGQYTNDLLISGEQYGIGGPDSVRGYLLREVTGDRGYSTQIEFYTPEFARGIGLSDSYRMRLLAFYDYGAINRNAPTGGLLPHESLNSAGLGVRFDYRKNVVVRLDFAQILTGTANREEGSLRGSGAIALIF